jgi:hypothetical protein
MKQILTLWIVFLLALGTQAQNNNPIAKIPFELEGEHIYIRVNIENSRELEFIFDTGAGATVINSSVVEELRFKSEEIIENTGASGKVNVEIFQDKNIRLNSLELSKIDLQGASLSHLEQSIGRDIDGIIGYDLLKKYVTEINYDSSELIIFKSKRYKYRGNGKMIKIDLGKIPTAFFEISLNDSTYHKEEFILDNGAGLAMAFTTPFSKRNNLKKVMGKTYPNNTRGFSDNIAEVDIGRVKGLKILDNEYKNIPANIYNTKVGIFALEGIAGILGNEILKRYNITFDYKRKRSYWEPNHKFDSDSFKVSYSGIKIKSNSDKSKVIVDFIIPDSVTTDEIKIGDEIIEIDGIKTSDSKLNQLRELLMQNGKKIRIKFIHNNKLKEIFIDLKSLI